jgi:hypothetical protein
LRKNSRLRPAGYTVSSDFDGGLHEADTLQCVHCGLHWQVVKGSGRVRGFCMRCNGVTCGQKKCGECVPSEQQLDNQEAGLPAMHQGARASFSGLILPDDMREP